jgi:hypothetical protein
VGFSSPTTTGVALGEALTMLRKNVAPNATLDTTRMPAMAKGNAAGRRGREDPAVRLSGRTRSSSILAPSDGGGLFSVPGLW